MSNQYTSDYKKKYGYAPQSKSAPKWLKKAWFCYRNQWNRCNNENLKEYLYWGGKGIKIEYSFNEFGDWFRKNKPRNLKNLTIVRIDHSKNYKIGNIEFQTKSENSKERIRRCGTPFDKIPVIEICVYTGLMVAEYESILDASKKTGFRPGSIQRWVNSNPKSKTKRKTHFALGV